MRKELSTGFGHLVTLQGLAAESKGCAMLMAVGDMVSYTLLDNGYKPNLVIYDLKTERRHFTPLASKLGLLSGEDVVVRNPAGQITTELVHAIGEAMNRNVPTKIRVEGEEDLAALACAAMAPFGSCLVYGIPQRGMALVKIDQEIAGRARSMIYAMEELN